MRFNKFFLLLLLLILTIGVVSAEDNSLYEQSEVSLDSNLETSIMPVSTEYTITDDTYSNYFDNVSGDMLDESPINDGDTLKIGNIENKYFVINKTLNIVPLNADSIMKNSAILLTQGAKNSNVTGIHIKNTVAMYSENSKINLIPMGMVSTKNVRIENCIFENTKNFAFAMANASYCIINNNTISSYDSAAGSWGGKSAFLISSTTFTNITKNKIIDSSANLMYFMPSIANIGYSANGPSNNIIIANNYFDATTGRDNAMAWGIRIMTGNNYYVCNITIANNTICNTNKVVDTGCDGLVIRNNTVYEVQNAFSINGKNNVVIDSNNITMPDINRAGNAISVTGGSVNITNNIIKDLSSNSATLVGVGSGCVANIIGNNITTGRTYAIRIDNTVNTTVADNKIEGPQYTGGAAIQIAGTNKELLIEYNYPNTIFYVSPDGTGTGENIAAPTNITYAFAHLESGMTVYFKKGTYNVTQTITASNVTLQGEDAVTTILDGQGKTQIADLNNVSITGLTFANGKGAIVNNGPLNITGCIFVNNTAEKGGAIYNKGNNKLNCNFSIFDNNQNAITNEGEAVIDYNWWGSNAGPSTNDITGCKANNWIVMNVDFTGSDIIKLEQKISCTVDFNNYTDGQNNYTLTEGALPNGYLIYINNETYKLNNGKVSYTYTANTPGNHSIVVKSINEKAIFNFRVANPTIIYVSPDGNGTGVSRDDPANLTYAYSNIGPQDTIYFLNGIYKDAPKLGITATLTVIGEEKGKVIIIPTARAITISSGNVIIENITILNATPDIPPIGVWDGVVSLVNCSIINSTANGYGGGLYVGGGKVNVTDCLFENTTSKGYGGMLYASAGIITIVNSTIRNTLANSYGGAIFAYGGPSITIISSVFENNKVTGEGNFIASYDQYNGFIKISDSVILTDNYDADIYLEESYVYIIANDNWWGTNSPNFTNDEVTTDSWLVINLTSEKVNVSTNMTLAFKVYDSAEDTLSDYNGTLPAREFVVNTTTGVIKPTNGTISNSVALNYAPNGEGKQIVNATVDNQTVTFEGNFFLGNTVTNETFFYFFDENGTLKSNYTNLTFEGEFSDLGVDYININKPIDLYGNNSNLNNIGLDIKVNNVKVDSLNFNIDSLEAAIKVAGNNVTLTNNNIRYNAIRGKDSYGVFAEDVEGLTIANNNITYVGATNGTSSDAIVMIKDSNNTNFVGNNVSGSLSSVDIDWSKYPISTIFSNSIVIDGANTNVKDNNINIAHNNESTSYGTIYALDLSGENVSFTDNNIELLGGAYAYGAKVSGSNALIKDNNIKTTSDSNYANGINVEGPFSGVVENNNITLNSPKVAYGIYSNGVNGVDYIKNNIKINATTSYGVEAMGSNENFINNTIAVDGNFTAGIVANTKNLTISGNNISASGNGIGTPLGKDYEFGAPNVGIYLKGAENATISKNTVKTTSEATINITKVNNAVIKDNDLVGDFFTGDASVFGNATIANNTPAMTRVDFDSKDIVMYFKNGTRWYATLLGVDGKPIAGANITFEINGEVYNRTTNANGTSSIALGLPANNYTGVLRYKAANVSAMKEVKITILPVVFTNDTVLYYHNGTKFNALFLDGQGKPLVNASVKFNINGVIYNRTTNANGTTSGISLNLPVGNYTVTAFNPATGAATSSNVTILSTIQGDDLVMYYRNGTKYNAVFLDGQGNPLNNTKVQFNINGLIYNRTTNANGTTSGVNLNLPAGNYTITAIGANGQMFSNNVTILPTIITENIVKYYKNDTQYEMKVVDGKGKLLANQTISLNINGVFYNRTTNENGSAVFKINLPAGTNQPNVYVITATCNDCIVSNNVTVLPTLTGENVDGKSGEVKYNIKLVDGQGNPLAGKKVGLNINGELYNRTTNAEGTTSGLTINLPEGKYIITARDFDSGAITSNEVIITA